MQEKNASYSDILSLLTDLVDNSTSGTLFVHTECNRSITIALDDGEIHAIYMGARRGRKAIPLISKITGGSYRFEVSGLVEAVHDLPPTHEILHFLRNAQNDAAQAKREEAAPDILLPEAVEPNELIDDKKKDTLHQELRALLFEHLGPIADVVFEDTIEKVGDFASSPELTQYFITKLSEEIDSNHEVQHFISHANVIVNDVIAG
jgi:hypothetical protein